MKNLFFLLMVFCGALALESCNEDSFSQVVDFDVPTIKNKLVINCNYTVGEDTFKVLVGKTRNVGETINTDGLDKCKVSLFRNNILVTEIPYAGKYFDENALLYRFNGAKGLFSDKGTYVIKVENGDFETAEAAQEIPDIPRVTNPFFQYKSFKTNDLFNPGEKYDLVGFGLDDPGEENYYMISAESTLLDTMSGSRLNSTEYFYLDKVLSKDGFFADLGNFNHFISDEKFNGKKFDVKLGFAPVTQSLLSFTNPSFDIFNARRIKITLSVFGISKQKFLYENSIEAKGQSLGNFFGESVTVNSNIKNGYGIFSIRNPATSVIIVP